MYKGPPSKADTLKRNVFAQFKPGERILYSPALGVSEKTYYNWARTAVMEHTIELRNGLGGGYFIPIPGTGA